MINKWVENTADQGAVAKPKIQWNKSKSKSEFGASQRQKQAHKRTYASTPLS